MPKRHEPIISSASCWLILQYQTDTSYKRHSYVHILFNIEHFLSISVISKTLIVHFTYFIHQRIHLNIRIDIAITFIEQKYVLLLVSQQRMLAIQWLVHFSIVHLLIVWDHVGVDQLYLNLTTKSYSNPKTSMYVWLFTRRFVKTWKSLIRTFRRSSRSDKSTAGVCTSYILQKKFRSFYQFRMMF